MQSFVTFVHMPVGAWSAMGAKAGEDCEDPVCSSRKTLFQSLSQKAAPASSERLEERQAHECPPDKEELGRATWTLMHTLAAYYPEEPSPAHRLAARCFLGAVAVLYPCSHCRERFAEEIESDPPQLDTRTSLSQWVCRQHNAVNELLGKPSFSCSIESLDRRWRTGSPACFTSSELSSEESMGQEPLHDTSDADE